MADDASLEASSSQVTGDNPESTIQINIKTLDSQIHTFRVGKNMIVQILKERIAEATGVPAGQQRLIFRGRVLKDDHALSEYHVEDGHTLHLVVRQPTVAHPAPGANSMEARGGNENNTTSGVPRPRIGQMSHGVVLGTINAAEHSEDLVADIGRLVGTVLGSFGIGGSNISTTMVTPPSAPPTVGTNGEPTAGNRTQIGNLGSQGVVIPNHPIQSFTQLSSFPSAVPFSRHMAIPDSLTTLNEFLGRMEQALPDDGSQPSPSPTQGSPTPDIPLNFRGLPTPDMLGSVIQRVRQLLSSNLATTLARFAERLEREGSSSDLAVRSHIQNEAGHLGVAMQHVGAMLLELGRTMMMLRMGQSPAESFVNAGPAVFISPSGPNPIMVQPFPLQSSSFFGIPPNGNGVSGPLGSVDPSRNINIHIHAGTSVAPGVSPTGARASSGEPVHVETPNLQQPSTNGNVLRDSTPRGLPARTIVAAIPARPATEASGHVLSIIYPVQVRPQQLSVPGQPGPTVVLHPNVNNGIEASMPNPVMQPSSVSDVVPSIVAQINANIAAALSNSAQAHVSSNSNMQSADSRDPNAGPQPQNNVYLPTAPCGHDHNQSSSSDPSGSDASGSRAFGRATLGSTPSALGVEILNSQAQSWDNNEASESQCDHTTLQADDILGSEQRQSEAFQVPDTTDSRSLGLDSLSSCSLDGALPSQSSSSSSSESVIKSTDKNLDSVGVPHPSCSSHSNDMSEGDRPLPLGLGLGGLQPKRRCKPAKPRVKDDTSRDTAKVSPNQGSIAMGHQSMQSLASEGSSAGREDAAGSLFPMPPYISQIMNNLPLGEQGANGQVDMGNMMSTILQSPAFNHLLTGVAEQTGVGSTADLRNMLEQCTQTPAVRNALNQIVEQVDGEGSDAGGLLSGLRRNQGGINLASMMQQMMPVVSQALGRGLTRSPVCSGIESEAAPEHADGTSGDDFADKNFQADLHQVVETIEQSDSPANIFRSVLESAARLDGLENHDLVEELGNDVELANEFVDMLKDQLRESNRRV